MKYYVCIQNCFEDYTYENCQSLSFDSKESAVSFVEGLKGKMQYPFDINGDIKFYFSDDDFQEFFQLIDVVPSDKYIENFDCYAHMPESIYSVSRHYAMDSKGNIDWCDWVYIEPEDQ